MSLALISSLAVLHSAPAPVQTLLESPQFTRKTNNNQAAERTYGIQTFANRSSKVSVSTGSGILTTQIRLASDGNQGYTANAGVMVPLSSDWAEHDLSNLEAIQFQYRLDSKISDGLNVLIGSGVHQPSQIKQGVIYQNQIRGAAALAASRSWKSANLLIEDFSTPAWWTAPLGFPTLDEALKRMNSVHLQPQTLYTKSGTQSGMPCTKCVGPATPSVTAEFRDFKLVRRQTPQLSGQFELTATDTAKVNALYAIQAYSNPASKVAISVGSGTLKTTIALASDGTTGYSANAGILIPLQPTWEEVDLRTLTGIEFEYRSDKTIPDGLRVSFGSETYSQAQQAAGTVYETALRGATALPGDMTWRVARLDVIDFATPAWWIAPADYPVIQDVLAKAKNLDFRPGTLYSQNGTINGTTCMKCVGPTMPQVTLELRNLKLLGSGQLPTVGRGQIAVPAVATPSSFEFAGLTTSAPAIGAISWHAGMLTLGDPSRWASVQITTLNGRQLHSLEPASRMVLDLPNGSYFAILQGHDGTRSASPIQILR